MKRLVMPTNYAEPPAVENPAAGGLRAFEHDLCSASANRVVLAVLAAGIGGLLGTGFEKSGPCTVGGGTFWLTTAGNVVPGQIVELRVVVWDVGDTAFDSSVLLDGFKWLSNATLPGTG